MSFLIWSDVIPFVAFLVVVAGVWLVGNHVPRGAVATTAGPFGITDRRIIATGLFVLAIIVIVAVIWALREFANIMEVYISELVKSYVGSGDVNINSINDGYYSGKMSVCDSSVFMRDPNGGFAFVCDELN